MSKLMICMKSGNNYIVNSPFKNINEMLEGTIPNQNNWSCFSLAEKDENGNDNVLVSSNEIEAFKYLGENNGD